MKSWAPTILAGLLGGASLLAQPPVDDLACANADAAWTPMRGTAPASVVEWGGRRALRLPCHFADNTIERVSWDRAVKLNLAACRGMRFDFSCADATPIARFNFYLHSGGGWYSGSFGPTRRTGWGTVLLDKDEMRTEGSPAGWGTIDTIRISAWRGENVDTEFYIANLAIEGADAPMVLIRGDSAGPSSSEARSVAACSKAVADALDRLDLPYVAMSDLDVTAERLKGRAIAILPYNPVMPDRVTDALAKFLTGGGRLLAFYALPPRLAEAAGFGGGAHVQQKRPGDFASIRATEGGLPGLPSVVSQASWNIRHTEAVEGRSRVVATWFNDQAESTHEPAIVTSDHVAFVTHVLLNDDPVAKRQMVLALLGYLDPRMWEKAVANGLARVGKIGPYASFDEALRGLRTEARAGVALAEAGKLDHEAVTAAAARQFPEAMAAAVKAREAMVNAFYAAQKPEPGEFRAWWCHNALGVEGRSWDQAIQQLARNGFNAILPNMLWGGVAYYPSTVLPVAPEVKEKGDQIAACLAACRKYGVQCHVWKVNWNMGWRAPAEFMERMRREGRTQVGFDGKPEPRWLCPSHPANQQLEIDAMVEVATKYDVDGIHFDYIRYPDGDHCFCAGCRERFETALGAKVAHWPDDTRNDPALRQSWLDFRRDNITRVFAAVHDAVKARKPNLKISAAVFRIWPDDRDFVGQDWKLWCDRGYVDFVCPMDYTPNTIEFEALVGRQQTWAGRVPCYPGIGLSTWTGEPDPINLMEKIQVTRRLHTGGFSIFNYAAAEADQVVPPCGQGITRKE